MLPLDSRIAGSNAAPVTIIGGAKLVAPFILVVSLTAGGMQIPGSADVKPREEVRTKTLPVVEATPLTPEENDILWLARCIYSESKRSHEQELIAWVVRNRVETSYRGRLTFEDVVLDPFQFSAFNRNSRKRSHYLSLGYDTGIKGFQRALKVAERVYDTPPAKRPFSLKTRHFYSVRSLNGMQRPVWADQLQPVEVESRVKVDSTRFQFFADVI